MPAKILVVEDFEQFRQFVLRILRPNGDFQLREASNGLQALQKAEEEQQDLILLDIGLPDVNGIDVAKRLQKLPVPPKILFITQESSPDLVEEALNVGALGYIHKMRVARDLLAGINAVLGGTGFVSENLRVPVEVASARANHLLPMGVQR